MLVKVKFIAKSEFGAKGEERFVTERAAAQLLVKELIAPYETGEQKEEKIPLETKEEKNVPETKEEKVTKAPTEEIGKIIVEDVKKTSGKSKAKVTKAPKL